MKEIKDWLGVVLFVAVNLAWLIGLPYLLFFRH